jgi:hypothetical protein
VSVAKIRDTFKNQVDRLAKQAGDKHESIVKADPAVNFWDYPESWEGNPVINTDDPMHQPFNRDESNSDYVDAIKDGKGTAGDLIISTLQVDILAQQERAFRARHCTRVRSAVHAAARLKMHSQDGGVFKRGHRAFLERILNASSQPRI